MGMKNLIICLAVASGLVAVTPVSALSNKNRLQDTLRKELADTTKPAKQDSVKKLPADSAKKKPATPSIGDKIKSSKKIEGLFSLYRDTATASLQLYVNKNQLDKDFIYQSFSMGGPTSLYLN